MYTYGWIHVVVQQRLIQHGKATILPLKKVNHSERGKINKKNFIGSWRGGVRGWQDLSRRFYGVYCVPLRLGV